MRIWLKLPCINRICFTLQLLWPLEWRLLILLIRLSLLTKISIYFSILSSYQKFVLSLRFFRCFFLSGAGIGLRHCIIWLCLSLICKNLINIFYLEVYVVIKSCGRHYFISWSSSFCPKRHHILEGDPSIRRINCHEFTFIADLRRSYDLNYLVEH